MTKPLARLMSIDSLCYVIPYYSNDCLDSLILFSKINSKSRETVRMFKTELLKHQLK